MCDQRLGEASERIPPDDIVAGREGKEAEEGHHRPAQSHSEDIGQSVTTPH